MEQKKSFDKSVLEGHLTMVFFNAVLRNILYHLSVIDKNFVDVAPKYFELSSEGIRDYINKICPESVKPLCLEYINNLDKEYANFIKDLKKIQDEEKE